MKFNIAYLGPENVFHLRRDFLLALKYSLEDLGHRAILAGSKLEVDHINLLVAAYCLPKDQILLIKNSGIKYINVNTEVMGNGMLNHNPLKVDFLGAYMPLITAGIGAWDLVADNLEEYSKYGVAAKFLRIGFHEKLSDIDRNKEKDLDYYFFGTISERRKKILQQLSNAGFRGLADNSCPYFLRNDRIARAKVQLNLIQDNKYSHVPSIRVAYLNNNDCYILSEREHDPAGYLTHADVCDLQELEATLEKVIKNNEWLERGRKAGADFSRIKMTEVIERLLSETFSQP